MLISRLASVLAERYSRDFLEEIARGGPDDLQADDIAPFASYQLKEQIGICFFARDAVGSPWKLWLTGEGFAYYEISLNSAHVIFYNQTMPDTEVIGLSGRSIPISLIVGASATFDPFFLRDDVIVEAITAHPIAGLVKGRPIPALDFIVTF